MLLDVSLRRAPRPSVRSDRAARGLALTALCAMIHLVADGGALLLCAPEWSPSASADYHRAHKLSRLTSDCRYSWRAACAALSLFCILRAAARSHRSSWHPARKQICGARGDMRRQAERSEAASAGRQVRAAGMATRAPHTRMETRCTVSSP